MRLILTGTALALVLAGCTESPATATATATAPASTQSSSAIAAGVTAQVNAIRAQAGQAPVSRNAQLDAAALAHARDMAANSFMGHIGSDGSDLRDRVQRAGYGWCTLAENVSRGYSTDARAVEAWRVSPGHYANLVKGNVREFGMANVAGSRVMVLSARRC